MLTICTARPATCQCVSVAAARALDEAVAVGTFGNSGVLLVCADGDRVERAVVLCHHIVLALRHRALDTVVLMLVIHDTSLLDKN